MYFLHTFLFTFRFCGMDRDKCLRHIFAFNASFFFSVEKICPGLYASSLTLFLPFTDHFNLMSEKYKSLKVKELTELLQKYKLSTSGKKEELIDRLVKYDEKQAIEKLEKEFELDFQNDTSSTSKIDLDDVAFSSIPLDTKTPPNLKESVLSDDEDLDLIMDPPSSSAKTVNTVTSSTSIKAATVRPDAKTVPATVKTVKSEMTKATHTAVKTTKKTTSTITTADTATALNNDSSGATITATPGKSDIKDTKFKFTPITFDKKEPEKPKTKEELEAERFKTEAEKKYERSKRFGVKLDDTEMKELLQ
ncbi:hypothetical protein BDF20DRAFT_163045 [Mycotypha africana]|uniref:uncharacterized protein n=1 Tax=Mycotypha africana TaxID=64632 RepID=UPI00230147B3|nr:uncharacterized protein BDF20DRAFT_163045 [Mycotypha africana]KAI8969338.1 hypothetical protein BDF20DRAFT_163045 [Mycotypha africana]